MTAAAAPSEQSTDLEGPAPSLFVEMLAEAVPPLLVDVGEVTVEVAAPPADAIADLDHLLGTRDVLDWLDLVSDELAGHLARGPWVQTLDTVADIRGHYGLVTLEPGLWTVLVERIDLYGEAIESDLSDRSQDLLDWFRGRRPWPQLLRIVDRLPPGSRYWAALLDDDDLARQRIEAENLGDESSGKRRPPLVGETPERALLRAIASGQARIEHAVFAVNAPKGKGGKPPSGLPDPETAEDRIRSRMGDADLEDLIAQATPWDAKPAPAGYSASRSGLLLPDPSRRR